MVSPHILCALPGRSGKIVPFETMHIPGYGDHIGMVNTDKGCMLYIILKAIERAFEMH